MTQTIASQAAHVHTEQCALLLHMLRLPLTCCSALARAADVVARREVCLCSYYEFCADETTRKWQWENRTRRETAFWNAVGLWLGGKWL